MHYLSLGYATFVAMAPVLISYRKAGVQPPVFLAGSYTDPPWEPREMKSTLDERGEHVFTSEVEVEADQDYQYKFKIGHGNNWDLDEQSPTTLDNVGNKNNLLRVSADKAPREPREDAGPQCLDTPLLITPTDKAPAPITPLFAHESLGAHDVEVVDDGFDHSYSPAGSHHQPAASPRVFALDSVESDVDDPTLEKFPCDKTAVFNTLRKLSTNLGDEPPASDETPLSPRLASRRTSVDSGTDSVPSPGSLSPTTSRKRDSRLSHSSVGRSKSAVSLGSIVEEAHKEPAVASGSSSDETPPITAGPERPIEETSAYTSDDGPELHSVKVNPSKGAQEDLKTQATRDRFSPDVSEESRRPAQVPLKGKATSGDELGGVPAEGKWYEEGKHTPKLQGADYGRLITGGLLLLALGITWWKSIHV